jgi:hypothetical protein
MARTAGDVIASAIKTVNDEDQDRYADPELLGYIVDALQAIKTARPDLFVGALSTPISITARTDPLPIDDQFFRPVVDYVIARCETKDDEAVVSARAELMFKLGGSYLA